ncbi:MAG TPA: hypothetical protein VFX17_03765 [Patescibacteria group bacterium]|nr:hypothetical protein [Patescibacteria group bacterium]
MKNPEGREIDYNNSLSVLNTGELSKSVIKSMVLDGSQIPITVSKDYSVYYGSMYHDHMVRDEDDILVAAYAKLKDGRVVINPGPHHKDISDLKLKDAVEKKLKEEFTKYL